MAKRIPILSIQKRVHLKVRVGERGEAEGLENKIYGSTQHQYFINTSSTSGVVIFLYCICNLRIERLITSNRKN